MKTKGNARSARHRHLLTSSALAGVVFLGLSAGAALAQSATFTFDIPAEPLAAALHDFAKVSGEQIIFTEKLVAGKTAPPLHGKYTADDALEHLLSGTGLAIDRSSSNGIMIEARPKNAQAASNEAADRPTESLETVLVTGTHIQGATPASPLVRIDRTQIDQSGYATIGDVLATLPQNFSGTLSPVSRYAGGSTTATNIGYSTGVDLRGLGDATLILVDGHRIAQTGVTATADVSAVPLGVIDHVDVLTDGASAAYGSDAIGGVVNIVLRKDFDGIEATGVVGGTSDGGGEQERAEGVGGYAWGSGNAFVSYDISHQNPIGAASRDFSQLAGLPTDLLPMTEQQNVTAFIRQDLSASVSIYAEGLVDWRHTTSLFQYYGYGEDDLGVSQQSYALGADFKLPWDWRGNLEATLGRDFENYDALFSTTGIPGSYSPSIELDKNGEESVELQASGPVAEIWSGTVQSAIGAGYRHETFSDNALTSQEFGRNDYYAYSEFDIPLVRPDNDRFLLEGAELNVSARYDQYSDVGASTNPKVGLIYSPVGDLKLRGTWGTAFRAPRLDNEHQFNYAFLNLRNDPSQPSGQAVDLEYTGGNEALRPEQAKIWTVGSDWTPSRFDGLKISATYFDYDFTNKIGEPIANAATVLTDPANFSFITFNPTPQQIAAIVANSAAVYNFVGPGVTPGNALAIVDLRFQNLARWVSRGVDLGATYSTPTDFGKIELSANATWLTQTQQASSNGPVVTVSGYTFGPPRLKARLGAAWQLDGWGAATYLNYISGETDDGVVPAAPVGSFTTIDAQVSYRTAEVLGGVRIALSAQNLLNRDPPRLSDFSTPFPGIGFDQANTSPLGRQVILSVTVDR